MVRFYYRTGPRSGVSTGLFGALLAGFGFLLWWTFVAAMAILAVFTLGALLVLGLALAVIVDAGSRLTKREPRAVSRLRTTTSLGRFAKSATALGHSDFDESAFRNPALAAIAQEARATQHPSRLVSLAERAQQFGPRGIELAEDIRRQANLLSPGFLRRRDLTVEPEHELHVERVPSDFEFLDPNRPNVVYEDDVEPDASLE